MNKPLRRSQRQRVVSKRQSDIPFTPHFDTEPPKDNIQLVGSIFHKASQPKVELTDLERELLEAPVEVTYCICGSTEAAAKGTVMIACDICDNWFHDECVGLTPSEAADVETYVCPLCSHRPKTSKKRMKPSNTEIDILIGAMEAFDDFDRPKLKKRGGDPTPKVAAYHLSTPINIGRFIGIVGYLRNESHPNPTLDNGFLIPVTQADLSRGSLATSWGSYRVAWHEGHLAASRDYSILPPFKCNELDSDLGSMDGSPLLGTLKACKTPDFVQFKFEGLPELMLPLYKIESAHALHYERLSKAMNIELKPYLVQKLIKDKLKARVSILGLYPIVRLRTRLACMGFNQFNLGVFGR